MEDISECQHQEITNLKTVRDRLCNDVKEITASALAELIDIKVSSTAEMTECARIQKTTIEKSGSRMQRRLQRTATKSKNTLESRGQKDKGQYRGEETDITEDKSFKEGMYRFFRSHKIWPMTSEIHAFLELSKFN